MHESQDQADLEARKQELNDRLVRVSFVSHTVSLGWWYYV